MIYERVAGLDVHKQAVVATVRWIKATRKELYDALHGRVTDHHRFRLRLHLAQYDTLAEAIAALDKEIDAAIGRIDEERESAGQAPFAPRAGTSARFPGSTF